MKILITGHGGQLASEFYQYFKKTSYDFDFVSSKKLDISDLHSYNLSSIKKYDCIINCAAYTDVEGSETDRETAKKVNSTGVRNLVKIAERYNTKLIHFSTDYIYNSQSLEVLREDAKIDPINFYGQSKREGEIFIENSTSESIVIRTSWLYSEYGKNFVNTMISKMMNNEKISVVNDQYGCPTYAKDLVNDVMKIIRYEKIDYNGKIYNYSNLGFTNWYCFAKKISEYLNKNYPIKEITSNELKTKVKRPKYAITDKSKIISDFNLKINSWENSLYNYIKNQNYESWNYV